MEKVRLDHNLVFNVLNMLYCKNSVQFLNLSSYNVFLLFSFESFSHQH